MGIAPHYARSSTSVVQIVGTTLLLQSCSSVQCAAAVNVTSTTPAPTPESSPFPTTSSSTTVGLRGALTAPSPSPRTEEVLCTDAKCCSALATSGEAMDRQLCEDFYDADTGVAITMMTVNLWSRKAGARTKGAAGFYESAPAKYQHKDMRSFSVTHSKKAAWPFPSASRYGIVYSLAPGSVTWKYFTKNPRSKKLCGQCTDGYACSAEEMLGNMTWGDFVEAKNEIVAKTGTSACKISGRHSYNEFHLAGLPTKSIAGVFKVDHGGAAKRRPAPSDKTACAVLRKANPNRMAPWPVFAYDALADSSSLRLERYLNCASESVDPIVIV